MPFAYETVPVGAFRSDCTLMVSALTLGARVTLIEVVTAVPSHVYGADGKAPLVGQSGHGRGDGAASDVISQIDEIEAGHDRQTAAEIALFPQHVWGGDRRRRAIVLGIIRGQVHRRTRVIDTLLLCHPIEPSVRVKIAKSHASIIPFQNAGERAVRPNLLCAK